MQRKFDFYIVPTPIGNIQDITLRALEVLNEIDLIACEDTRITQKLLNHYQIKTRCVSYHKYNERERVEFLLQQLREGKRIALVSDAGTPMICDPGEVIVEELLKNGFTVTSLAGACAITTFLSRIPRKGEEFTFIGFIGRSPLQIKEVIKNNMGRNLVFYDSPERILKTLSVVKEFCGNVKVALGRELSKLFEEVVVDDIDNILEHYKGGIKGEIICMIYANTENDTEEISLRIKSLKNKGYKDKDVSIILSTLFDYNKNEVYKKSLAMTS
jgi:16S rRNA (cytidine1402-2'-O)-methyltransferase